MKKNGNHKTKGNGQTAQTVRVEFRHPTATTVAIVGTFNGWRPEASPMVAVGAGRWLKELVLAPGTYEYLLLADGQWLPDPAARGTIPNPFGGVNSLLTVPRMPKSD